MRFSVMTLPDLSARPHRLTVERAMAATPHELFRAWTEQLERWFAAPDTLVMRPEVDQPFYFETQVQGERHAHYGHFLKLDTDRVVELTWITAGGTHGAETVLTVNLTPMERGTQLRLEH